MFDLIIANPPYGKQGTTCIPIIKKLMEVSPEVSVLAPQNIFFKGNIAKHADYFKVVGNVFEDAVVNDLSLVHLIPEEVNKYTKEDVSLPARDLPLAKAIRKYNETHKRTWEKLHVWNSHDPKKLLSVNAKLTFNKLVPDGTSEEVWKAGRCFFVTMFSPVSGVHRAEDSHDIRTNLKNESPFFDQTQRVLDAFVFSTKEERDNFREWWYSCTKGEYNENSLTNRILHIIEKAVSQSSGSGGYITYFPYLDWTKEWTDEEIIAELKEKAGLPKDWIF